MIDNMVSFGIVAMVIVIAVIIFIVYHKAFDVMYFGFKSFLREIGTIFIISIIVTTIILGSILSVFGMDLKDLNNKKPSGQDDFMTDADYYDSYSDYLESSIDMDEINEKINNNESLFRDDNNSDSYDHEYIYEGTEGSDDYINSDEDSEYNDVEESCDEYNDSDDYYNEDEYYNQDEYDSEYIFSYSDSVYLTDYDLQGLDKALLRFVRNEIYARHGAIFKDIGLQHYFESKSWYSGTVNVSDFDASVFNEVELENIKLIKAYENQE